LPPLRERKEDLLDLVEFFISKFNAREKKNIKGISDEAIRVLMNYEWPGNIRELENVIERMVVLEDTEILQVSHLPDYIRQTPQEATSLKKAKDEDEKKLIIEALQSTKGNRTKASKLLGISRRTLITKIKKYNLEHL
jgi:two-component system response regulator AtoC